MGERKSAKGQDFGAMLSFFVISVLIRKREKLLCCFWACLQGGGVPLDTQYHLWHAMRNINTSKFLKLGFSISPVSVMLALHVEETSLIASAATRAVSNFYRHESLSATSLKSFIQKSKRVAKRSKLWLKIDIPWTAFALPSSCTSSSFPTTLTEKMQENLRLKLQARHCIPRRTSQPALHPALSNSITGRKRISHFTTYTTASPSRGASRAMSPYPTTSQLSLDVSSLNIMGSTSPSMK